MSTNPSLTIIIPVYNTEKYLARCLNSLVNQSCVNSLECIIINDGSNDNSQEVINFYVQQHPFLFKAYTKINGGLSDARNFGLQHVTGKYLAFLDSDDWVDNTLYAAGIRYLDEQQDDDFVSFNYIEEWGTNKIFVNCSAKTGRSKYFMSTIACNKIFRTKFWQQHHFSFKYGIKHEDTELIPQLIYYAKSYGYLHNTNHMLHYERTNLNSITNNKRDTKSWCIVFESLKKFSLDKKDPDLIKFVATTLFYQLILYGGNPAISWKTYKANRSFFDYRNIISKPQNLLKIIQKLKFDFILLPILHLLEMMRNKLILK